MKVTMKKLAENDGINDVNSLEQMKKEND